jgi:hypothetical protein
MTNWLHSFCRRLVGRLVGCLITQYFYSFIIDLYKNLVNITYKILFSVLIVHPSIYKVKYLQSWKLSQVLHGAKYLLLYIIVKRTCVKLKRYRLKQFPYLS